MVDRGGQNAPEHDLQLRVPEVEPVVLVDEHDIGRVAELLGQSGRELQATETCTEDHDAHAERLTGGGTGAGIRPPGSWAEVGRVEG